MHIQNLHAGINHDFKLQCIYTISNQLRSLFQLCHPNLMLTLYALDISIFQSPSIIAPDLIICPKMGHLLQVYFMWYEHFCQVVYILCLNSGGIYINIKVTFYCLLSMALCHILHEVDSSTNLAYQRVFRDRLHIR